METLLCIVIVILGYMLEELYTVITMIGINIGLNTDVDIAIYSYYLLLALKIGMMGAVRLVSKHICLLLFVP